MDRTYMKTGLFAVMVMALIISPVCAQSGNLAATANINITIAGSTTVLPIAEECASAYIANNPGSQIDVSGGGSSYGVKAVANGTVDIGTASRDLKDSEIADYPYLVTHAIARDGVAIVVNPSNSVAGLTMAQLQGIYTGTITNWADLGGTDSTIVVVSREGGSGTRDCFEQAVLKPIGGEITEGAVIMDSNGAMRTEVSGNGNAIGYLSLGYVDSSVSAVSLDGILPTIENIQSGDYAISRTLLMITNGTPDAEEYAFLDFVLSEDGQQIVEDENFIPVAPIELQIAGSTTVLPIAEECASAYIANNPGSQIDVSGGGSSYGVKAVANGTVDIGTASRDLKDSEIADYPYLVTHAIARDGVAIVVNPSNSVAGLTMAQLQGIYTGTITNWADLGGTDSTIVVVSREGGSGTRDCFEQAVLKPIGGEITEGAVIMDSNGAMRTEVSGNGNAIGYLSLGYVDSSVSAVSLDGILPTIENIQSGDYAISRTLLMITNGTPDDGEQAFLDFVLSEEGQQIVEDENFIPVSGAVYTISIVAGWNMVSIPVIPADANVNTIFGDEITPPVYEYDAGYSAVTSLEPKKGYWVLANSPADIVITGTAPTNPEVTLYPGWNLIGPVSPDVQVSSFTGITPPVYGYDAGYTSAETLEQTKGYWVLASAETTLTV